MDKQEGNTVVTYAQTMADIFEQNMRYISGEVYVTNEGLQALASFFDNVELELRAPTYEWFIVELNARGVDYDANQFMGEA